MNGRARIAEVARENGWEYSGQRFVSYTKCATRLTVGYTRDDHVSWARGDGFHVSTARAAGKADQVIGYLQSDLLADGPCTLLAMSAAGETMVIADTHGDTWLVSIYAPDKRISDRAAATFVARGGWTSVDQFFPDWRHVHEYRSQHALTSPAPTFPPIADYTAADVHAALRDTSTAEDPDEIAAAHTMLEHIIERTLIVRRSPELRTTVAQRLIELQRALTAG